MEIAELGKDLPKENDARKEGIDKLEAFVKSASVSAVGELRFFNSYQLCIMKASD